MTITIGLVATDTWDRGSGTKKDTSRKCEFVRTGRMKNEENKNID
jgi:hypothetical protein